MRLSLAVPTEPRSADTSKDSLLQNCFIDTDTNTGVLYAAKRAGKILKSEPSNITFNRGIFFNPGTSTLYYINDFDNPVSITL